MLPILASLLGSLAENGLGLLSSAIQAKGKDVVEKTLGVKIPDNPTPEDVAKLRWPSLICWPRPRRATLTTSQIAGKQT
jgi:hypothetical protein